MLNRRESFISSLKLEMVYIPKNLWKQSLFYLLPRNAWRSLRREYIRQYGYECEICGSRRRIQLHELWEFDDKRYIQTLTGLILVCWKCHRVIHLGGKERYYRECDAFWVKHFCKVNGCREVTFWQEINRLRHLKRLRDKHKYKIRFGEFKERVEECIAVQSR